MNLHAELCLDTHTPKVQPVHADQRRPFIFLEIAGLLIWAHDPEAFRRLARACVDAAEQLETAQPTEAIPVISAQDAHLGGVE